MAFSSTAIYEIRRRSRWNVINVSIVDCWRRTWQSERTSISGGHCVQTHPER